jgi:hypothetical protein
MTPSVISRSSITALRKGLFNHLVGAAEQRQRDGQAEHLGGLEVDHELEFGGLTRLVPGRLPCVDAGHEGMGR